MSNTRANRRDFLKATAGIAAGTAAPYIWTSSYAKAQESKNDKLNVAAVGVGPRGSYVANQAGKLGNMVACADVNRGHAERFAGRYDGKCEIYEDYRKVLDRKDVDVITCGTPDHWHTKIVIDAMKAGKDVYCEKPLTLTIGESKHICKVTKETGRVFQVGTQQRSEYNRMFLKATVLARSGRLGKKLHAVASITPHVHWDKVKSFAPTDPPAGLNWDFWLGQAPKVDFTPHRIGWNFRGWLEYNGGDVTDWGAHHIDSCLWALDGDKTGAVEIEGKGDFPYFPGHDPVAFLNGEAKLPLGFNTARKFDSLLTLPNGNTTNLVSGQNEIIISGEKGRIRVNRGGFSGKLVEEIAASKADTEWLDQEVQKLYRGMPITTHMGNFFHCIKTRELPISDVYTHVHSVNACHMANIAMILGRKIKFDPDKCEFVGDEQATALINRRQREPYTIEA